MAGTFINLDALAARPRRSSSSSPASQPLEPRLLDTLDAAINALSPTELSAETTAGELDARYPAGRSAEEVESFLWSLWTIFLQVVRRVPAGDVRQQLLVNVIRRLQAKDRETVQLWGKDTRVWADLPMLGPCMREAWNTRPSFDGTGQDDSAVAEWISLNSFAARVLAAELQPWDNFAVWELRASLEEDLLDSPSVRDAQLEMACEWLTIAGKHLYDKSTSPKELDEAEARSLRPGKLAEGVAPGFSIERWKFWLERLGELAKGTNKDALKDKVERVVKLMRTIEG